MTKLTEQQITDIFKNAPEGYNYYMPNSNRWIEVWFTVENGIAIKSMRTGDGAVRECGYFLKDILEGGAIKRPEPKEETNMIELKAIGNIRANPEMHGEVSKYGGSLMYNKSNSDIYWVSDDDDPTSYAKWSDTSKSFLHFEWRNNGLEGLDLIIVKYDEYKEETNMKTTMDTVNYFKGEWPCSEGFIWTPSSDNNAHPKGGFHYADSKYANEFWVNVCGKKEFNRLVSECGTNFGESVTYAEYKLTEQPKEETNMIYTQEMHDNGKWPDLGMEFTVTDLMSDCRCKDFDGKTVTVISNFIREDDVVIAFSHPTIGIGCLIARRGWVKPLPPVKTELEIAQEKQVIDIAEALREDDEISYTATAKHLQEKGMLAEIIYIKDDK